jgi:hypothetical protein
MEVVPFKVVLADIRDVVFVVKANHLYAAQYAMENGCILSMQQHLFAAIP